MAYKEYSTTVYKAKGGKPSEQMKVIDIYALRQNPGVVNKTKGNMVNTAAKSNRILPKDEGRR